MENVTCNRVRHCSKESLHSQVLYVLLKIVSTRIVSQANVLASALLVKGCVSFKSGWWS